MMIIQKLWEEYELTKREAEAVAVKIDDSVKANKRLNELMEIYNEKFCK